LDLKEKMFKLTSGPEILALCSQCGGQIIVKETDGEGNVMSEFRDAKGRCFDCAFPAKAPR